MPGEGEPHLANFTPGGLKPDHPLVGDHAKASPHQVGVDQTVKVTKVLGKESGRRNVCYLNHQSHLEEMVVCRKSQTADGTVLSPATDQE